MSSSLFSNNPQDSGDEHMTANGVVDAAEPLESVGTLYDPGPSFSEDERPAERLTQMPAWLQTFAATVGEPHEDSAGAPLPVVETTVATVAAAPAPDEAVTELPSWLAEERTAPASGTNDRPSLVAPVAAALISEDDLPEWLRSIAPADSDADGLVAFGADAAAVAPGTGTVLAAPSIKRAWTLGHAQLALSEGATMFALMARESVATALPGPPSDSRPATASAVAQGLHGSETTVPELASPPVPAREAETAPAAARPRRMWMIYALALLLVILVLVAARLVI